MMTTVSHLHDGDASRSLPTSKRKGKVQGAVFDWAFVIACFWLIGGGYIDSWAHYHIMNLETFFTWWHGVLYAGLLAVGLVVLVAWIINRARGYRGTEAIPQGYELATYGVILFFIAGVADAIWHTILGFETNIDGQFSPPHLAIMTAYGFIAIGWYRSLWLQRSPSLLWLKLILSTFLVYMFTHLLLMPIHPYNNYYSATADASQYEQQLLAATSFILYSVNILLVFLPTVRRWKLPLGFFTGVFGLAGIAVTLVQEHFEMIPAAIITGIVVDIAYQVVKPSIENPFRFRLFAALLPFLYYIVYFTSVHLLHGTVWTMHMLGGTILIPGILGWLLTYFVIPPSGPVQEPGPPVEGEKSDLGLG